MPVDFLTEEQRARYGRFNESPDEGQLGGFFHLDRPDRRRALACNGARNQLGFAIQLGTVRFLGTFLPDPGQVPEPVTAYIADQLGLDPGALSDYGQREVRWDHQEQIRRDYGYRPFDFEAWFTLARWLYTRCWLGNERPLVLFDRATAHLVDQRTLLPGVTVLERLVAAVRDRAETRLWRSLARIPTPEETETLLRLLTRRPGARQSDLDRLRRAPRKISGRGLVKALERVDELECYRAAHWGPALAHIPPGRMAELVRHAKAVRAQAVAELTQDRKIATLIAFAASMPDTAADEALEVFEIVMDDLLRATAAQVQRGRLRTLRDLDAAALMLGRAWRAVTAAAEDPEADIRAALTRLDLPALHQAARTVADLALPPADDTAARMAQRYLSIIRFLPKLLGTLGPRFQANPAGKDVLGALPFVASLRKRQRPIGPDELPDGVLTPAWRRRVIGHDGVDKRGYTVAFAEALREALRRHDIFVPGLRRFGDPHARLLAPAEWQAARAQACADLGLSPEPGPDLQAWSTRLDESYRRLAQGLAANPAVRIEQVMGQDHLVLTGLDRLETPESLTWLDAEVAARMPSVDLPEMVLEVHGWVPFLGQFTHVSGEAARAEDITTSIAAVLCAEATNVGMQPVVNDSRDALKRDRLFWIEQNYLRAACTTRATALLAPFHIAQPIVGECWGGGEFASADGLRFVTPVRTINSRPNPHYFGPGARRGLTFYNYLFDMYLGLSGIIVPGTQRDSLYILDGLLEQDTAIRPVEITSDTHGASEMVFGLFRLLGYQFSPRLADAGSATLYRVDAGADYGALGSLTRERIRTDLITMHCSLVKSSVGNHVVGARGG
ncbi:MAG TPA: Tn3 family transposase [Actinocrinis sp.]|nr:Tn3 family transposase [Actinocrinis sp.]